MEFISTGILIAIIALLIIAALSVVIVLNRKKNVKLSNELDQALEKLATAHADMQALQQRYQESLDFQQNLNDAELTTRLQQTRLSAQHGYNHGNAPERYLYVKSLAQNGMSAEEIASVLSISTREAEQLVNLSKLANISS